LGVDLNRGGAYIIGHPNETKAGYTITHSVDVTFHENERFFTEPSDVNLNTFRRDDAVIINGIEKVDSVTSTNSSVSYNSSEAPVASSEGVAVCATYTLESSSSVDVSSSCGLISPSGGASAPSIAEQLALVDSEEDISTSIIQDILASCDEQSAIHHVVEAAYSASDYLADIGKSKDPSSWSAALHSSDKDLWLASARKEWDQILVNATGGKIPDDCKKDFMLLPTTTIFKQKPPANGNEKIYKTRVCIRGDLAQSKRDQFEKRKAAAPKPSPIIPPVATELQATSTATTSRWRQSVNRPSVQTYAPTVSATSVRSVLSLFGSQVFHPHVANCIIATGDVSNAFCLATLPADRKIAIKCPFPEFAEGPDVWYELTSPLYGLDEAPKLWSDLFQSILTSCGLTQCETDPCLYKYIKDGRLYGVVCVFVDDVLFVGDQEVWNHLKVLIAGKVKWQTHENPNSFLGMDLMVGSSGLFISHHSYITRLLEKEGLEDCNPTKTPMDSKLMLPKLDTVTANPVPYQTTTGSLIHTQTWARPDISLAVHVISKHLLSHGPEHFAAIKKILRYLQFTKDKGIHVKKNGVNTVEAYFDATWASDPKTRKSVTGVAIFHNGVLVAYYAKEQKSVSLSSCEAEIFAISQGLRLLTYVRRLLLELQVITETTKISCFTDSQSAMAVLKSDAALSPQKHIDIRLKHVKELLSSGVYDLMYVPSEDNIADMFTKPLPVDSFTRFANVILRQVPGLPKDKALKRTVMLTDFVDDTVMLTDFVDDHAHM
jgi:hypothetical protein